MTPSILLKNAFLIDGTGLEPIPDATVAVTGDKITEVDSKSKSPPGGRVIDLKGKTLMPGLIDAHVHPGNVEFYLRQTRKLPPAVYVHRVTQTLKTDLRCGFTTLRDAGGLDQGFRDAIEAGLFKGPRLFLSVTPLTQSGANPDGKPEPRNSLGIYPEICDGQVEISKAVRRTLGRGADQIKMFADGEVVSQSSTDRARPGQYKFTLMELRTAVETAKASGSYVMAHAYCPQAIRNCLRAGVRSIEHGNLMDSDTARLLADSNAYFVPTLSVFELIKSDKSHFDRFTREKLQSVAEKGFAAFEMAHQLGAKIASGSDIIGPDQHRKGLELVIKAEVLSPMGAIIAATRTNAELMGISNVLGIIEPGKIADMIVVDQNPLENITVFEDALKHVKMVIKGGEIM